MMQNFEKKIVQKLKQAADLHSEKDMADNVFATIKQKNAKQRSRFGIASLALAATISGMIVLPSLNEVKSSLEQQTIAPKLSPQMFDDLEMLSVLGVENGQSKHS